MDRSRRSGGLDNIIKKLQVNTPAPAVRTKASTRTGSSRRKPAAVTRHVLSEPDENSEDDFENPLPFKAVPLIDSSDEKVSINGYEKGENGQVEEDKTEEEKVDIHLTDEGIPVLPDGTVVVQPEAVPDDVNKSNESRNKRSSSASRLSHGVVDVGIVHCTSCGEQVNPSSKAFIKRHPTLNVLLCRRCHNYYTSDNITKDEDGTDEQCQWCGEGGKLVCCDFCTATFCRACIKRNLGRKELSAIDDAKNWTCYVCDSKPLLHLTTHCDELFEQLKNQKGLKKKRRSSVSSLERKTESESESLTEEIQRLVGDTERVDLFVQKKDKMGSEAYEMWKQNMAKSMKIKSQGKGLNLLNVLKDIKERTEMLERALTKCEDSPEKHKKTRQSSHKRRGNEQSNDEPQPSTSSGRRSRLDVECERALLAEIQASLLADSDDDSSGSSDTGSNYSSDEDTRTRTRAKLKFGKSSLTPRKLKHTPKRHSKSLSEDGTDAKERSRRHRADSTTKRDSDTEHSMTITSSDKVKRSKNTSDSSDFDSELEDEIDSLSKNLKKRSKPKQKVISKETVSDSDSESTTETQNTVTGLDSDSSKACLREKNDSSCKKKKEDESSSSSSSDEEEKESYGAGSDQELLDTNDLENEDYENEDSRKKLLKENDSDDSDIDSSDSYTSSSEEEVKKKKKSVKKKSNDGSQTSTKEGSSSGSNSDDDDAADVKRKSKKRNRLLRVKISESDSSDEFAHRKGKRKNRSSSQSSSISSNGSSSDSSIDVSKLRRKTRSMRKKSQSDDTEGSKKTRTYQKTKGKKRRRIKVGSNSSDSDSKSDDTDTGKSPKGKGRRKIRKVLTKDKLQDETKNAAKEEAERRKRVAERRKQVIQVLDESPQKCPVTMSLVLESKPDSDEPLVQVNKDLIKKLKPHQVEAVQFMWDCCIETYDKLKNGHEGGGCILAHCMGLGKTLSVFTFIHTILSTRRCKMNTCLVVAPLNTVLNWVKECEMWLPPKDRLDVYEMASVKDNWRRADNLQAWHDDGGILIMGYDMYRALSKGSRIRNKKLKKIFHDTLVDPGPDIVVCDEGHILKNDASSISEAMHNIRTLRRICLTGTPLQNNLVEYHCMVSFVKPNLLGTRKEFCNRFANPIINGQHLDSTPRDVKIMKKRAHVLHDLLSGCVQRKDYSALTKFLPPKHEYVVSIRLCEKQIQLYKHYLETKASNPSEVGGYKGSGSGLFADYQVLLRVWTHPHILRLGTIRDQNRRRYDDSDSMDDFINDTDDDEDSASTKSSSDSDDVIDITEDKLPAKRKRRRVNDSDSSLEVVNTWKSSTRGGEGKGRDADSRSQTPILIDTRWYSEIVTPEDAYNIELGGKLVLLMDVLQLSEDIGDKVLVFSQSLLSLDIIEDFLEYIETKAEEANTGDGEVEPDPILKFATQGAWVKGIDYFRMDGSTSAQNRKAFQDLFNDPENLRARLFLISTKAGSLGINLVSANRVIIFDASWNPTHDVQSIFRVYRFGQTKACFIYRFLAQGTMEEKIYERQVTKQSLSRRVVDQFQIERHFTSSDLAELYNFNPDVYDPDKNQPTPMLPKDFILAELLSKRKEWIVKFHEHDSLLENIESEELDEEERKTAWAEYEAEKEGRSLYQHVPEVPVAPDARQHFLQQLYIQQQRLHQQQQSSPTQQYYSQQVQHLQRLLTNGSQLLHSGEKILQQTVPQPGYVQQYRATSHMRLVQHLSGLPQQGGAAASSSARNMLQQVINHQSRLATVRDTLTSQRQSNPGYTILVPQQQPPPPPQPRQPPQQTEDIIIE